MTDQLESDFRGWVASHVRTGINGNDEKANYLSGNQLKAYWSIGNLRDILSAIDPPIAVSIDTISEEYLRVFSILVFTRQPRKITLFLESAINDKNLPLRKRNLPEDWYGNLDDILDHQWPFCPWEFTVHESDQRKLPAQQILPILYPELPAREVLSSATARIHKVIIDDECRRSIPQEVVFKTYNSVNAKQLYDREAAVYTRLRRFNTMSITRCYGSLAYNSTDKRIIILEYAPRGSLLDLFYMPPPVDPKDFKRLWKRLVELFEGLHILHNPDRTDLRTLSGIHQDIQPANILVFPGETDSTYDVHFKLADFGLADIVRIVEGEGATAPVDNEGNRMYSAPEAYPNYRVQSEVRPHLNSLVDLWSLGAVFSDFLVWSIGGPQYRERYREVRKRAISNLQQITERGFDACFHDGRVILPEVSSFHEEVLGVKRHGDFVSPAMSGFILQFMMVEPGSRLLAGQAKGHAVKTIAGAQVGSAPQRQNTPDPPPPGIAQRQVQTNPPRHRNSYVPSEGMVSVREVYDELKRKSNWKFFRKHRSQSSETGMRLPGMQRARNKINLHGGRDQIFVIDDHESMRGHMKNVAMTAKVISYSVKVSDQDGMDLYFASDSCNPRKCKNSSEVEDKINCKETVSGCCDMRKCLEDVMARVKENGTKPTGIYIFTDAIWDPDHQHKVDQVIHESIRLLVSKGAKPTNLMFQFIQFGHDTEGSRRLKYLDDDCTETHGGVIYDIVDTKNYDDHVPKIIMGSICEYNDKEN